MFHSHLIDGKITPVQDYLILRPIREEEKIGELFLPDSARHYGLCPVVAAGPKCELKDGDTVYIQKFVEGELKFLLNDELVYAIRERHINVAMNPEGSVIPIRAIGTRILVRRVKEEKEEMRGGIYIPKSATEVTQRCDVLSVGSGMDRGKVTEFEVKPGSRVLISKYAGTEVRVGKEEFTIINEGDVVGTLDESGAKS